MNAHLNTSAANVGAIWAVDDDTAPEAVPTVLLRDAADKVRDVSLAARSRNINSSRGVGSSCSYSRLFPAAALSNATSQKPSAAALAPASLAEGAAATVSALRSARQGMLVVLKVLQKGELDLVMFSGVVPHAVFLAAGDTIGGARAPASGNQEQEDSSPRGNDDGNVQGSQGSGGGGAAAAVTEREVSEAATSLQLTCVRFIESLASYGSNDNANHGRGGRGDPLPRPAAAFLVEVLASSCLRALLLSRCARARAVAGRVTSVVSLQVASAVHPAPSSGGGWLSPAEAESRDAAARQWFMRRESLLRQGVLPALSDCLAALRRASQSAVASHSTCSSCSSNGCSRPCVGNGETERGRREKNAIGAGSADEHPSSNRNPGAAEAEAAAATLDAARLLVALCSQHEPPSAAAAAEAVPILISVLQWSSSSSSGGGARERRVRGEIRLAATQSLTTLLRNSGGGSDKGGGSQGASSVFAKLSGSVRTSACVGSGEEGGESVGEKEAGGEGSSDLFAQLLTQTRRSLSAACASVQAGPSAPPPVPLAPPVAASAAAAGHGGTELEWLVMLLRRLMECWCISDSKSCSNSSSNSSNNSSSAERACLARVFESGVLPVLVELAGGGCGPAHVRQAVQLLVFCCCRAIDTGLFASHLLPLLCDSLLAATEEAAAGGRDTREEEGFWSHLFSSQKQQQQQSQRTERTAHIGSNARQAGAARVLALAAEAVGTRACPGRSTSSPSSSPSCCSVTVLRESVGAALPALATVVLRSTPDTPNAAGGDNSTAAAAARLPVSSATNKEEEALLLEVAAVLEELCTREAAAAAAATADTARTTASPPSSSSSFSSPPQSAPSAELCPMACQALPLLVRLATRHPSAVVADQADHAAARALLACRALPGVLRAAAAAGALSHALSVIAAAAATPLGAPPAAAASGPSEAAVAQSQTLLWQRRLLDVEGRQPLLRALRSLECLAAGDSTLARAAVETGAVATLANLCGSAGHAHHNLVPVLAALCTSGGGGGDQRHCHGDTSSGADTSAAGQETGERGRQGGEDGEGGSDRCLPTSPVLTQLLALASGDMINNNNDDGGGKSMEKGGNVCSSPSPSARLGALCLLQELAAGGGAEVRAALLACGAREVLLGCVAAAPVGVSEEMLQTALAALTHFDPLKGRPGDDDTINGSSDQGGAARTLVATLVSACERCRRSRTPQLTEYPLQTLVTLLQEASRSSSSSSNARGATDDRGLHAMPLVIQAALDANVAALLPPLLLCGVPSTADIALRALRLLTGPCASAAQVAALLTNSSSVAAAACFACSNGACLAEAATETVAALAGGGDCGEDGWRRQRELLFASHVAPQLLAVLRRAAAALRRWRRRQQRWSAPLRLLQSLRLLGGDGSEDDDSDDYGGDASNNSSSSSGGKSAREGERRGSRRTEPLVLPPHLTADDVVLAASVAARSIAVALQPARRNGNDSVNNSDDNNIDGNIRSSRCFAERRLALLRAGALARLAEVAGLTAAAAAAAPSAGATYASSSASSSLSYSSSSPSIVFSAAALYRSATAAAEALCLCGRDGTNSISNSNVGEVGNDANSQSSGSHNNSSGGGGGGGLNTNRNAQGIHDERDASGDGDGANSSAASEIEDNSGGEASVEAAVRAALPALAALIHKGEAATTSSRLQHSNSRGVPPAPEIAAEARRYAAWLSRHFPLIVASELCRA